MLIAFYFSCHISMYFIVLYCFPLILLYSNVFFSRISFWSVPFYFIVILFHFVVHVLYSMQLRWKGDQLYYAGLIVKACIKRTNLLHTVSSINNHAMFGAVRAVFFFKHIFFPAIKKW